MAHSMSSIHQRVMTQHHPYEQVGWRVLAEYCPTDRTRVAQVEWQRVTIWKSICLFFWSRGTNHFEGDSGGQVLMNGVKVVCLVCAN
jgi:hypothetical protein